MEDAQIHVKPLPYKSRQQTFGLLLGVFLVSLPFLYLYATGYRFDFQQPTNLISTGGIYVAVEASGAEIYIDGELVRETRTFRKAFYAQNLDAGTHRVHVQKEGFQTWVKELPVTKHLVTEAEAFNLPLVPQVRVISEWQSATGSMVVRAPITHASTSNEVIATTTKVTKNFAPNSEYTTLIVHFSTTTQSVKEATVKQITDMLLSEATTTPATVATTTIVASGVKLYESGEDVYATWIDSFEQMPYYYCAPDFPAYSTTSTSTDLVASVIQAEDIEEAPLEAGQEGPVLIQPVQTVPPDVVCDPTIRIDRKWQTVNHFEFLPGSTDFVLMVLDEGIYVVEVDDRSWQNVQPLMLGKNLQIRIENGNIFVYDGTLIYQILPTTE